MGTSNYSDLLKQKSTKFFTDTSNDNHPEPNNEQLTDISEKIQLNISINQIKKRCSYKVLFFNIVNNEKKILNELEIAPQQMMSQLI